MQAHHEAPSPFFLHFAYPQHIALRASFALRGAVCFVQIAFFAAFEESVNETNTEEKRRRTGWNQASEWRFWLSLYRGTRQRKVREGSLYAGIVDIYSQFYYLREDIRDVMLKSFLILDAYFILGVCSYAAVYLLRRGASCFVLPKYSNSPMEAVKMIASIVSSLKLISHRISVH